jgi:hypothetical protein
MLTRKRQKLLDSQEKLNLELSTTSFQFHPILESISQFLCLKDCSQVSNLNHTYHGKTWLYVLQTSNRFRTKDIIKLDTTSMSWIYKYRLYLNRQSIMKSSKLKFDLSKIPKLLEFHIVKETSAFPLEVKDMYIYSDSINNTNMIFPTVIGVEFLYILFTFPEHILNLLNTLPMTLKELNLASNFKFNCELLPVLPNLLVFRFDMDVDNVECIREKFPNLVNLCIFDFYHSQNYDTLNYFEHTLIINSTYLINTQFFITFKCHELDLSNCPNIEDFSGVAHIPIVKKHQKLCDI